MVTLVVLVYCTAVATTMVWRAVSPQPRRGRVNRFRLESASTAGASDLASAERAFEASVKVARVVGSRQGLVYGQLYRGHAALDRGDAPQAAQHFSEVLTVSQATHDEVNARARPRRCGAAAASD
jgi:hypothetical protein